ncbi:MAG: ferritin-like domain-containing protein [Burkholderiales bacterium]
MKLFATCEEALALADPHDKRIVTDSLADAWHAGTIIIDIETPVRPIITPGFPRALRLVDPRQVEKRSMATGEGRAALAHAIAHIEFNAIHLALDACYRFRDMPAQYYGDWLGVAAEEARHFGLLAGYLGRHGYEYGSFPAHNGLWEMAESTRADVLARMALVPRVMEARGLDVTPGIRRRFAAAGDHEAVAILDVILQDEIGHIAIGNRWYRHLCEERNLDPQATFDDLAIEHRAPRPHLPLNRAARLAAGFHESELDRMEKRP